MTKWTKRYSFSGGKINKRSELYQFIATDFFTKKLQSLDHRENHQFETLNSQFYDTPKHIHPNQYEFYLIFLVKPGKTKSFTESHEESTQTRIRQPKSEPPTTTKKKKRKQRISKAKGINQESQEHVRTRSARYLWRSHPPPEPRRQQQRRRRRQVAASRTTRSF